MKKVFLLAIICICFISCTNNTKTPDSITDDSMYVEVPNIYSDWKIVDIWDVDINGDDMMDISNAIVTDGNQIKHIVMIIDIGQFYFKGDTLGNQFENK
jgi:hypothetical protein